MTDIQDLAVALRPMINDGTMESAVDELIRRLPAKPTIHRLSRGQPRELLGSVNEELFAIIVEAVRNARRHARADSITVRFQWGSAHLSLSVTDDGEGFDLGDAAPSGLRSMRERAQIVGARLSMRSNSSGTSIDVKLPLGRVTVRDGD
jgi:signal transduction histidine kinase